MSIDLNSLVEAGQGTSLSDLVSDPSVMDMPINNEATANNMASHAALLVEPEAAVDTYNQMMGEFRTNNGSPTFDQITTQANKREEDLNMAQMGNILSDDNIPIDQKVSYASLWRTGQVVAPRERSPQELIGVNQLEKEGITDGNDEADNTRWDLAGKLREVNEYNAEIHKMITQQEIANDPGTAGKVKDFVETIMPLLSQPNVADVLNKLRVQQGGDDTKSERTADYLQTFLTLGETKDQIRETLAKVPVDQRLDLARSLYEIVTTTNQSITGGKNALMLTEHLRDYLVEGQYTTSDRIIDDITGVLDLVGVGSMARGAIKGLSSPARAARFMRRNPISVGETVANTNTASANDLLKMVTKDETGKVADVVYGTSRTDAIVNNVGPEIGHGDGTVRYKPLIDDDQFDPDVNVTKQVLSKDGSIQFSPEEKASKLNQVVNDFTNPDVTGLNSHKEMTTIQAVDDGVQVRTVFSPVEGGFSDPQEAIQQVKVATRKYGVTDDEITLLKRSPDGTYKVVDPALETAMVQARGLPPLKTGFTRFYHGGAGDLGDPNKLDDLWVTPQYDYARDYRRGTDPNNVWYVDIPNDKLGSLGVRDEVNGYNINGKLPKEWATKVKKYQANAPTPNGNYAVGINHISEYDPADTIAWSTTSVKGSFLGIPLNIFDKLPVYLKGKGGSITQHLIPPQSYIDPLLTRSASTTADKAAYNVHLLTDLGNEWADKYTSLSKTSRKKLDNYILQANHDSTKFNPSQLRADGWTTEELSAFRSWKKTNDTLYVLENTDLVRQSKRKGFEMFETADGQDRFLVKPISNSTAGNMPGFKGKIYDPEIGQIRNITSKERTDLYKNGGSIAIARTPVVVGEQSIPYVLVRNNGQNYSRALRETDKLLNYRDGHFTIYYKNPVFITKKVKNADGSTYERAIATSETIQDGNAHLSRLKKVDPKGEYTIRSDRVGEELDEMLWNSRVNTGRTAQRTRGETLTDVTDRPTDLGFRHIATPEESLLRSINSISRRISFKEYLDTAKARFSDQYKDFLPIDPQTHARIWPDSVKDLRKPDLAGDSKAYTDAVSTFRYIDQMENGFVNLLDDASKNFFKAIAETSGQKGFTFLERTARKAEDVSPTAYARKKAFRLLLAANPLRQGVVQASQALPVIIATNPKFLGKLPWQMIFTRYLDRGGDTESFIKGLGKKLTGITPEEALQLEKAYKESGISSAVSAHSLIRDDLKSLVNRGVLQKARAVAGKPIDVMQKVGFEAGENMLMRSVWLSEYDTLRKSGKPITKEALGLLHARVRDLTLNMNKAGEMAYNENALSAIMQFAQAPHKALAQILAGNRALSKSDRIKLGTSYVVTYGTGYGLMYEAADKLLPTDDRELHEIVSGGLFNLALNRTLGALYGEDVDVDFSSSMRLIEIPHLIDMWNNMATMDVESLVTGSPSIALVVGDNARLGNLVKSMARFFTVPDDDGAIKDVGVTFLNMFSGASNIMKARYAYQRGYMINTKGEVVDENVNELEAMMRTMGFQTVDEMLSYQVGTELYFNSKSFRDDIKYLMDETTRRLAREGISEKESEYVLRMYREANRVWENNPAAMQVIQAEINRRSKTGDHIILNRLIEQIPFIDEGQLNDALSKAPMTPDKKRELQKIFDFMKAKE